jgi:fluoroquinolone transport system permease protein
MLLAWFKFELKNLLRNKMTVVMIFYPLILGWLGRYLIVNNLVPDEALALTAMLMTVLVGFAYGAMAGFSLLDDRDDQVFISIRISPVSLNLYIWFKVLFAYLFALVGGFFIVWFSGAVTLSAGDILLLAALSALQTPITAFLVNAFAHNKVEGFVTMKASGFMLLFPIGSLFFLDAKEWLFAVAPAHWAAKAVQRAMLQPLIEADLLTMNLSFYQYIAVGVVYNLILVAATFHLFRKKNEI